MQFQPSSHSYGASVPLSSAEGQRILAQAKANGPRSPREFDVFFQRMNTDADFRKRMLADEVRLKGEKSKADVLGQRFSSDSLEFLAAAKKWHELYDDERKKEAVAGLTVGVGMIALSVAGTFFFWPMAIKEFKPEWSYKQRLMGGFFASAVINAVYRVGRPQEKDDGS